MATDVPQALLQWRGTSHNATGGALVIRQDARWEVLQRALARAAAEADLLKSPKEYYTNFFAQQGFTLTDVLGGGNCLFRALAAQLNILHRNDSAWENKTHENVRAEIVSYMRDNREYFINMLCHELNDKNQSFDEYLDCMGQLGEWGCGEEISAASKLYKVNIDVWWCSTERINIEKYSYPFEDENNTLYLVHFGSHYQHLVRVNK